MQFSTNPNQAIKIESFEEFQATTAAVEAAQDGSELVNHLRGLGRRHYSLRTGAFIPTVLVDNEIESIDRQGAIDRRMNIDVQFASVAYNALKQLSRSDDPHYAPVARFMLEHAEFIDGPLQASDSAEPVTILHDPVARN